MKRILAAVIALLMIGTLSVAAEPYTETDFDDYFVALHVQRVWVEDFPEFTAQFMDADLDGRYELISIEKGEEYAPKQATVYDMMHAELSGRGRLTVGKLETCYDPKTDEYFMVNRMVKDGEEICERLVYNYDEMIIEAKPISNKQAKRLEDCGYAPVIITKEECEAAVRYEEMYALLRNAYDGVTYTKMQPTMGETYNEEEDQTSVTQIVLAAVGATVVALAIATVALLLKRRKRAEKKHDDAAVVRKIKRRK